MKLLLFFSLLHSAGLPAQTYDFAAVTEQFQANLDAYGGRVVAIVEQTDRGEIFRFEAGAITQDTKLGVASCSKWLSGAIVLACAERGGSNSMTGWGDNVCLCRHFIGKNRSPCHWCPAYAASSPYHKPMKLHLFSAAVASILLMSCSERPAVTVETDTKLFNGTDLDGWSHVLVGDGVKKEDVWSVKDGVLVCKGTPLGYLVTKTTHQDFTLSFEWRWAPGGKPGNSGVLLRIAGEPATFMPKCVEAQLKHENAGDLWAFFGANITGDAARFQEIKDHKDLGNFKGIRKTKAAEKPPGEWNRYEINVSGGKIELKVNGEIVNQASGLDVLAGPIGLQSEGAEIHFRNIGLKETPP
jgi:hypothetical protein